MFNESNTVEAYLYDLLSGPAKPVAVNIVQEPESHYGHAHKGLGWRRIASADFPRQTQEVLVEKWVREALIRLNPEIAADPDKALLDFLHSTYEAAAIAAKWDREALECAPGQPGVVRQI